MVESGSDTEAYDTPPTTPQSVATEYTDNSRSGSAKRARSDAGPQQTQQLRSDDEPLRRRRNLEASSAASSADSDGELDDDFVTNVGSDDDATSTTIVMDTRSNYCDVNTQETYEESDSDPSPRL